MTPKNAQPRMSSRIKILSGAKCQPFPGQSNLSLPNRDERLSKLAVVVHFEVTIELPADHNFSQRSPFLRVQLPDRAQAKYIYERVFTNKKQALSYEPYFSLVTFGCSLNSILKARLHFAPRQGRVYIPLFRSAGAARDRAHRSSY